jgi:malate dehydrogenase (oxaloacetate-decarboxylating)
MRSGATRATRPRWPAGSGTRARRHPAGRGRAPGAPHVLIGTSTRPAPSPRRSSGRWQRTSSGPVILPMSNPTELCRGTPGRPHPVDRRAAALVATGSPFARRVRQGITYVIGQANNALVFPGLGLGVIAARASRITDNMLSAAARAVSGAGRHSAPRARRCCLRWKRCGTHRGGGGRRRQAACADGVATAPLDGGRDRARCGR